MVLNTRPTPQLYELNALLTTHAIASVSFPLFNIVPLQPDLQSHYDIVVITSRFAVPWFENRLLTSAVHSFDARAVRVICVGPSTAGHVSEAINRCNDERFSIELPNTFNSEGILELLQKEDVSSAKIAILKGRGGRGLLEKQLLGQAQTLDIFDVYERVYLDKTDDIRRVVEQPITCIIVTSVEIGHRLVNFFGIGWLTQRYIIAASDRIKSELQALGLELIVVSKSSNNDDIVNTILTLNQHK